MINMLIYIYTCIYTQNGSQRHNDKGRTKTPLETYTSQFICKVQKGFTVRGSWRPNRTPTLMAVSVVSFSFSRAAQPEAQGPSSLLDDGFLYCILSPTGLQNFGRVWLSLTHLVSDVSEPQLSDFLSWPSYIIVKRPVNLWNGMFDRHQAEITVMQFRGYSLPVHPSMSVSWAFTSSHFVSQNRLRDFFRLLAIGMCHFLPVHHFEMACLPRPKVNT